MSYVRIALFTAGTMLVMAGCSASSSSLPPDTHPVIGKLLDKSGQPITKGMLEFSMLQGTLPKTSTAELNVDGTFSLSTFNTAGVRFSGAEPGEYRVTYYPLMSAAQSEVPITLRKSQRVEAKANELTLRLE